jgi:CRP/FNR family transcriptional regulator
MQIDTNILIAWGGIAKKYAKNEVIFHEDTEALFYYQVVEGQVKMININNDGKEYIQGIFHEGCSFGEPPLFVNEVYPTTAIAQKDSIVLKLSKSTFLKLLDEYPELTKSLLIQLAHRIYNKTVTARELIHNKPEDRILAFLKEYKKKFSNDTGLWLVPHTRQEIANLTGLRVETVIRALKKMETTKQVQIINHKLYY